MKKSHRTLRPPSTTPRRHRTWRPALAGPAVSIVAIIVVALAVIVYAGFQVKRRVDAARLPLLPDLSAQPQAMGDHLRERDRVARADPTSAAAVGAARIVVGPVEPVGRVGRVGQVGQVGGTHERRT